MIQIHFLNVYNLFGIKLIRYRNDVDTYAELKSELLYGDHVEAIGFLSECGGSEALNGDYVVGYQIQRFNVINEGEHELYTTFYYSSQLQKSSQLNKKK